MAQAKYVKNEMIVSPTGLLGPFPALSDPDLFNDKLDYKAHLILDPADEGVGAFIEKVNAAAQAGFDEGIQALKDAAEELGGKKKATLLAQIPTIILSSPISDEYDDDEPTGRFILFFKRPAKGVFRFGKKEGQEWTFDLPLFDAKVGQMGKKAGAVAEGSLVKLEAELNKYCAGGIGRAGVSLRLCSAQVMELVTRDTPAGSSFTSHEGGYEAPEESEEDELPEAGDLSAEQELADDNEDF
jgi:hypothetical protein